MVLLLLLVAPSLPSVEAAKRPRKIKPNGRWHRVEIKAIEEERAFTLPVLAGARYRLTLERRSLTHPVIRAGVGVGAEAFDLRPEGGETPVVHDWEPVRDQQLTIRVRGFSAFTGKARLKIDVIGPDGTPSRKAFRWLDEADTKPRSGDLILGEANTWELVTEVGKRYEIVPGRGSGNTLHLRVLDRLGREIATSAVWRRGDHALAPVRFEVPPLDLPAQEAGAPRPRPRDRLTLEVRGRHTAAGQYQIRMYALAPDQPLLPAEPPPPEIEGPRQHAEGSGRLFLRAGDLALLFLPPEAPVPQLPVRSRATNGRYVSLQSSDAARLTRGHAPGYGNFMGLRARQGGEFLVGWGPRLPAGARLVMYPREQLAEAPVLSGTSSDPTVRARVSRKDWRTIGIGLCLPDLVYLFVALGAPGQGVGMRITDLEGKVLARRPASGEALPYVRGHGPSQRFRVQEPGLVLLQVKGSRVITAALMRQLQGSGR